MKEQKSKNMLLTSLAAIGVMFCFSQSHVSLADESNSDPGNSTPEYHHKKLKKAFKLGVCVGQALAADGIKVPLAEMEQASGIDAATKEKIKQEIKTCRDEMKKVEISNPNPTAVPSSPSDTFDPENRIKPRNREEPLILLQQ